ncbi:MAG: glycosyltransferase [Fimbriiglobus sp.]
MDVKVEIGRPVVGQRPRIISYTSGLNPCGVASYQARLAAALAEFAEVVTVRFPTARTLGQDLTAMRVRRREIVELARQSRGFTACLVDYTDTFFNGSRLGETLYPLFTKHLAAPHAVILHENFGRYDPADVDGGFFSRVWQRLTHLVWTTRDTGTRDYLGYLQTRLFQRAKAIWTHSPTLVELRPYDNIRLLPTPAYELPAGLPQALWPGQRVLVLLGFPQATKGFDTAIRALPHLPEDVVVVQIGDAPRCAAYVAELQALADQLGVRRRWIRTGVVQDGELRSILERADVGLAPFRQVHQSSSIGHLIGVGMPIVASQIPAIEALAKDGAGILFTNTEEPEAFAQAILDALSPTETRSRLMTQNHTYTQTHSFRVMAQTMFREMTS